MCAMLQVHYVDGKYKKCADFAAIIDICQSTGAAVLTELVVQAISDLLTVRKPSLLVCLECT